MNSSQVEDFLCNREVVLESSRLALCNVAVEDIESKLTLDQDPEVKRFLNPPPPDQKIALQGIKKITDYYKKHPGFGSWSAIDNKSGKWIGWFSLRYVEGTGNVEIGCSLLKEYRGQGYVPEMSDVIIKYAFDVLNLEHIHAMTHPENIRAKEILKHLGWQYIKQIDHKGSPRDCFILCRDGNYV